MRLAANIRGSGSAASLQLQMLSQGRSVCGHAVLPLTLDRLCLVPQLVQRLPQLLLRLAQPRAGAACDHSAGQAQHGAQVSVRRAVQSQRTACRVACTSRSC